MAKYEAALKALHKDMAFSKSEVYIYAELPSLPYEFIENNQREALAESLSIGMEGLLPTQEKALHYHLHVTSIPFDTEEWYGDLLERSRRYDVSSGWPYALRAMKDYMDHIKFRSREVYLGLKLGDRADYKSGSATGSFRAISDLLQFVVGGSDDFMSDDELEFWDLQAQAFRNRLQGGALRATEVKAEQIARLLKESLWPEMPYEEVSAVDRQTWGTGEVAGLAIADVQNASRHLKITQFLDGKEVTGYRATLCFSRFPDEMQFPGQEPWIHSSALLGFPTTIFSRGTIEPARKVVKVVEAKEKDALDQFKNSNGNAPIAVLEQLESAQVVKHELNRQRRPWVFGRHRIVVTAKTKEDLDKRIQRTISHYKGLDIDLVLPSGDQMKLLLESQPADTVRSPSYYQRQEIGILPIGMPSASGKVGDTISIGADGKNKGWLGPYIGYTNSRVMEPVFMSIHSAISRNNPGGAVITGAPGGGKTFAGLTLTYLMAMQDVWTVFIDPKGDAIPMADLPELAGRVRVFDMQNGHEGLLDPFTLAENLSGQKLMALEVIQLLIGGADKISDAAKNVLSEAINTVAKREVPSLYHVVDILLESNIDSAKGLGNQLELIRGLPFARLCFAPNRDPDLQPMQASDGLTIISLKGLNLPANNDKSSYTTSNHLAIGIMYLITRYTESLMYDEDDKHPKAVVIDEAWAITSTPQGAAMIPRIGRMGRALNTALLLISQNANDFLQMANYLPYRLAFGTKATDEIESVAEFLGLEKGDDGKPLPGNFKTIHNLEKGECLMRDPDGRIQSIKIDNNWNPSLFDAFNTNPDEKIDRRKSKVTV